MIDLKTLKQIAIRVAEEMGLGDYSIEVFQNSYYPNPNLYFVQLMPRQGRLCDFPVEIADDSSEDSIQDKIQCGIRKHLPRSERE